MVGVYITISVTGIFLVALFIDQIPEYMTEQHSKRKLREDIQVLICATLKQLRHTNQLLLIPLTMYSGLEQGFLGAEFNKVNPDPVCCISVPV